MRRPVIASAGVVTLAGGLALAARHAGLGHGWVAFAGIVALFAWIAFERLSRR